MQKVNSLRVLDAVQTGFFQVYVSSMPTPQDHYCSSCSRKIDVDAHRWELGFDANYDGSEFDSTVLSYTKRRWHAAKYCAECIKTRDLNAFQLDKVAGKGFEHVLSEGAFLPWEPDECSRCNRKITPAEGFCIPHVMECFQELHDIWVYYTKCAAVAYVCENCSKVVDAKSVELKEREA